MNGWTTPDQDTMCRWRITSPASNDSADGRWHATDGTIDLSACSLDAPLNELDWLHAT